MNWVDLAALVLVAVSAALAFMRGFVREALGILSWAGAGYASYAGIDFIRGSMRAIVPMPEMADVISHSLLFLGALLALMIVTGVVAQLFHSLGLGAVDRSLGVLFGLFRGGALMVAAYIGAGWVTAPERWPDAVRHARLLPVVARAATWTADQIPERYRPSVPIPPPEPVTRSMDLLQAVPLGRPAAPRP